MTSYEDLSVASKRQFVTPSAIRFIAAEAFGEVGRMKPYNKNFPIEESATWLRHYEMSHGVSVPLWFCEPRL